MILETCSRESCVQLVGGLRAALQERDAEIAELKSIAYSDDGAGGEGMKLFLQVRAQRKVLETALNVFIDITTHINMKRFWRDKDGIRFDEITDAAITAIQEVLA